MTYIRESKKFFGCFTLAVYVCKLLSDIGSEKNHQSLIGHYLSILGPKETNNVLVNRVVSVKKVPKLTFK